MIKRQAREHASASPWVKPSPDPKGGRSDSPIMCPERRSSGLPAAVNLPPGRKSGRPQDVCVFGGGSLGHLPPGRGAVYILVNCPSRDREWSSPMGAVSSCLVRALDPSTGAGSGLPGHPRRHALSPRISSQNPRREA